MPVARHILELLAHEHVLLVYRIAFAQRLCDGGEQACELVVAVDVGRILLHGGSPIRRTAEYSPVLVYSTPMPSTSSTVK